MAINEKLDESLISRTCHTVVNGVVDVGSEDSRIDALDAAAIHEPATLALLGVGLARLAFSLRKE